ncbi:MAG: XrtA system polysaccharide deacetylase [Gemmataceae bacterium]
MSAALTLPAPELTADAAVLNALTVDVEDYFHVSGFDGVVSRDDWDDLPTRVGPATERLLDLFAEADVRGTFFILGWLAERQPSLVRAIRAAGHEIGCHSYGHRLVYEQTVAEFRSDLRRGLDALEDAVGERVTLYRAPSFSITEKSSWALDVLAEEGIRIDSSIYPVRHDRYGMPDAPITPHRIDRPAGTLWEFPPPVARLWGLNLPAGGGGYFRLAPYPLTRWALNRINADGRPFAAYLHPWEIDPDQPRVACGWKQRFRHYTGLTRTEGRLVRLLRDFRFGTMSDALTAYHPAARVETRRPAPVRQTA